MKKKSKRKEYQKKVLSPNFKPAEPGFGPFLSQTPNPNSRSAFSQVLSLNSEPAKHGLGTFLYRNSKPAKPGFSPVFSLNSEPAEPGFDLFLFPNSKPAEPGFRPFLSWNSKPELQTKVLPSPFSELQTRTPNQGSAQSFLRTPNRNSELWVKTQSWTKLAKPGRPACNYSVSGRPQHSRVIVWTILQTGRK